MTSQNGVNLSKDGLDQVNKPNKTNGLPPVHLWNPPFCGDMDMVIKRDGSWIHEGGKINRPELVKLFASILRKDGSDYFLVTPVEKVGIRVEDVPFIAVDLDVEGIDGMPCLTFTTNVDDKVTAGPDHPLRLVHDPETGEPSPYVMVRAGLEARLDRKTFYRLVDLGVETDSGDFGVFSAGRFFKLGA